MKIWSIVLIILAIVFFTTSSASAETLHTVLQTCYNVIHQLDGQPWPVPQGYMMNAVAVASTTSPKLIRLQPALAGSPIVDGSVNSTPSVFSLNWKAPGGIDFVV